MMQDGNTFSFAFQDNKVFKDLVPFTFIFYDITLYLPVDHEYYIRGRRYYLENAQQASIYGVYDEYLNFDCRYRNIYYSPEENRFVCNADEDLLESAKTRYIREKLVGDFDTLSSIQHENKYKNTYYGRYGLQSDWSFDDISFLDDSTLSIDFSDRSLDINAQVNIEGTGSELQFTNFEIRRVDVSY